MTQTDPEEDTLGEDAEEQKKLRLQYLEAFPSHRTLAEHFQRLSEAGRVTSAAFVDAAVQLGRASRHFGWRRWLRRTAKANWRKP